MVNNFTALAARAQCKLFEFPGHHAAFQQMANREIQKVCTVVARVLVFNLVVGLFFVLREFEGIRVFP